MLKLRFFIYISLLCVPSYSRADTSGSLASCHPQWLQKEGIVMAGSWEPLAFRLRRDGNEKPTVQQLNDYAKEHSPETIAKLKALGVNFVMIHCYKGAGLRNERESMQDSVKFAKLCHDAGLKVGVYNYSGAFIWDCFFKEVPEAKNWLLLDNKSEPVPYDISQKYRYFWNRNHPEAQEFYKRLVRFAIEDVNADLLHWDNYSRGPGYDKYSVQRFREYLKNNCKDLIFFEDINNIEPPQPGSSNFILSKAWLDFCCQSLADSYYDMGGYARKLKNDILIECNPQGVSWRIRPPVDHSRILCSGDAYWNEQKEPGYDNSVLRTRIRDYKVGRKMNNMVFTYNSTPLACAEAMAFNLNCLGCVSRFEWARFDVGQQPINADILPYIKFFNTRREFFTDTEVLADVAILRNFSSQVLGDSNDALLTFKIEQMLIEDRIPFQIIYNNHLCDIGKYKILILAGCKAISDIEEELIKKFVVNGGKLYLIGNNGQYNEWMQIRSKPAFSSLPPERVIKFNKLRKDFSKILTNKNDLVVEIEASHGLCTEITRQKSQMLLHLVNYNSGKPAANIMVKVRIPKGYDAKRIQIINPQRQKDIELEFTKRERELFFIVPIVEVYEIASIKIEKL